MKYRFIFTPHGWLIVLAAVSLLVGAAILDSHSLGGIWTNIMIAVGSLLGTTRVVINVVSNI